MRVDVPSGVPNRRDYDTVVASPLFADLENYSSEFLGAHPIVQASYGWVDDPLHQWSRQWEYPFVYRSVVDELERRGGSRIDVLDAGSGATFFPFLLKDKIGNGTVTCCDYDASLERIFDTVNGERDSSVAFRQADLRALPFADDSFDIVYCVSVLEHTNRYETIVDEFHRVLRSGGLFIGTFDIGLDGVSDIPPAAAARLSTYIESRFSRSSIEGIEVQVTADSITSADIGASNPALLPWRYPFLSLLKASWKRKRPPSRFGKNLTVLCACYFKS